MFMGGKTSTQSHGLLKGYFHGAFLVTLKLAITNKHLLLLFKKKKNSCTVSLPITTHFAFSGSKKKNYNRVFILGKLSL